MVILPLYIKNFLESVITKVRQEKSHKNQKGGSKSPICKIVYIGNSKDFSYTAERR